MGDVMAMGRHWQRRRGPDLCLAAEERMLRERGRSWGVPSAGEPRFPGSPSWQPLVRPVEPLCGRSGRRMLG